MQRLVTGLYLATVALHLPWGLALGVWLEKLVENRRVAWSGALLITATLSYVFHGRVALWRWDRPREPWQRVFEELYFVHWCALFFAPLALVVGVVPLWRTGVAPATLFGWGYLAALAPAFWGVVVRRRWLRLIDLEIAVSSLPPAFDGYTIVQLSDLHLGSLCPAERVRRWVRRANGLGADLVVLTGDYVTSGVAFHQDIASTLGALRAPDGVVAVMGNHDYHGDGEPLMSLLRAAGIRLLRNERISLQRAGASLQLAGIEDVYTGRVDVDAALAGHEGGPMLVLAHDPISFPELADRGASLVLSGHTHWGQVGVPFVADRLNYARFLGPLGSGLHHRQGATLFVHPGMGTTGPPLRLGVAPAIVRITLRGDAC